MSELVSEALPGQCSLPMYGDDQPELRAASAVVHRHVQRDLRLLLVEGRSGQMRTDGPLLRGACDALWSSPELLWSQTCGQPLFSSYPQLTPVGAPTYSAEGCTPGFYCSWIVVRSRDEHRFPSLSALAGATLAVNSADSWSGAVSLRCAVERLLRPDERGALVFFHPEVRVTGSHRDSLRALQAADVHCAAIDCITWDLLRRTCPAEVDGLTIIGRTESTPAPPVVVQTRLLPELGAAVADAFGAVCSGTPRSAAAPEELRELRAALQKCGITGFTTADASAYQAAFADRALRAQAVQLQPWAAASAGDDDAGTAAQLQEAGYPATAHAYFCRLDASGYSFPVSTTSAAAQRWFSRGMQLSHGFNHEQAMAAFRLALGADPACVMAHWGLAYCSGVNYNAALLEAETMETCCKHAAMAAVLLQDPAVQASPLERQLCGAIALRAIAAYPGFENSEKSQSLLQASNELYAQRMRGIYDDCLLQPQLGPLQAEVTVLAVEAVMQLRPWKLWPPHVADESVELAEEEVHADTLYAQRALEISIAQHSPHPGLAHFYVHLMEMAPRKSLVRRACAQADILRRQYPACGHLLHMASHIDLQLGAYSAAIAANVAAIQQDDDVARLTAVGRNTYYHGYRLHNHHMLCYSAMFAGQSALALSTAEEACRITPAELIDKYLDYLEPQMANPWHALIRFGRWEELLTRPLDFDIDKFVVCHATALYAKALALASLGRVEDATAMQSRFEFARALVPASRFLHNVTSNSSLQVASFMLKGELAYRSAIQSMPCCRADWVPADLAGVYAALDTLEHAAQLEAALPYDEPWGWMQPVSHAIGALAIEQARRLEGLPQLAADAARLWAIAQAAYERDLAKNLDNVWSLLGLRETLQHARAEDSEGIEKRLCKARLAADEQVAGMRYSCFCAGLAERACCGSTE